MHYFVTLPAKLIGYALYGTAFGLLYQWFVIETFNLQNLSWSQLWGLGLLIRFIGDHYTPRSKEEQQNLMLHTIFTPIIATVIGYVLYQLKPII